MEKRNLKCLIRVFQDGSAEVLEGQSLKNYWEQQQAARILLLSNRWTMPKSEWVPVKKVEIER